jgi:hypothetical protein
VASAAQTATSGTPTARRHTPAATPTACVAPAHRDRTHIRT